MEPQGRHQLVPQLVERVLEVAVGVALEETQLPISEAVALSYCLSLLPIVAVAVASLPQGPCSPSNFLNYSDFGHQP
jgi:hypothetical protein